MKHLGDAHNFGRRVSAQGDRVAKPRTVFWEWLVLARESPLRRALDEAAGDDATFAFLPSLAFEGERSPLGGVVERVSLAPLPRLDDVGRRALARVVGRATALFSWLGVADLHWENLALGQGERGAVFAPLDVEMILDDLEVPTATKLLPDADPEYAAMCRHAAGVRRALPYLGKPVNVLDLLAMARDYARTLALLDGSAKGIAEAIAATPGLREAPIRVLLRATGDYVSAGKARLWPPLLEAEREQLDRGDVPYFFRLYGEPGIRYWADAALATTKTLPRAGDVPQLAPLLSLSRGLRSPSRRKLREDGLFTLLGAFDHASFSGVVREEGIDVTFGKRDLAVKLARAEELKTRRDLSGFVSSVYLPCACGEVTTTLAPAVTRCTVGR